MPKEMKIRARLKDGVTTVKAIIYHDMESGSRKDKDTGEINTRYAPRFKVKLPFYDGVFKCPVYNSKKQKVSMTEVVAGSTVQALIRPGGLWFIPGGKFGLSWRVEQMKIKAQGDSLYSGYFWYDKKNKSRHAQMRGHGGQRIHIDIEKGSVLVYHSIAKDYDNKSIWGLLK